MIYGIDNAIRLFNLERKGFWVQLVLSSMSHMFFHAYKVSFYLGQVGAHSAQLARDLLGFKKTWLSSLKDFHPVGIWFFE